MVVYIDYQVAWLGGPELKVSWQPSSNLKKCLIDKFEQGITCDVVDVVSPSYGSTAHTPVVSQKSLTHDGPPPPSKRKKRSTFAAPPDNGYIVLNNLNSHTHTLIHCHL